MEDLSKPKPLKYGEPYIYLITDNDVVVGYTTNSTKANKLRDDIAKQYEKEYKTEYDHVFIDNDKETGLVRISTQRLGRVYNGRVNEKHVLDIRNVPCITYNNEEVVHPILIEEESM